MHHDTGSPLSSQPTVPLPESATRLLFYATGMPSVEGMAKAAMTVAALPDLELVSVLVQLALSISALAELYAGGHPAEPDTAEHQLAVQLISTLVEDGMVPIPIDCF